MEPMKSIVWALWYAQVSLTAGGVMATRISSRTRRDLEVFGANVARWRKIQGLTAQMVADRAAVTRATLRSIEHGEGTARTENLFAVLRVLGQSDAVVTATDPLNSDLGRLHAIDKLPAPGASTRSGADHRNRSPSDRWLLQRLRA